MVFFFFGCCQQLGHGDGRAMEEVEREETCSGERESQTYKFFLGLEISIECIK